jgi:cytochrome c biogenesis factor
MPGPITTREEVAERARSIHPLSLRGRGLWGNSETKLSVWTLLKKCVYVLFRDIKSLMN